MEVVSGESSSPTPAARAAVQPAPPHTLLAAMWEATSEEEQAVSTETAGPLKAKV